MPRIILKIHDDKFKQDYYLEWSTIVDAPVIKGMPLNEFKQYYIVKYGDSSIQELEERLKLVEQYGTSNQENIEQYFEYNRAGEDESFLSKEQILNQYCRNQ